MPSGALPEPAERVLEVLHRVADAVAVALAAVEDWGPSGRRDGQYAADLTADGAALDVLHDAGFAVLSEESGLTGVDDSTTQLLAIVDPLDGSTNASMGVPWFATSILVMDADGPLVGLVADQAAARRGGSGSRWWAVRGGGAFCDGAPISPSACSTIGEAVVGLSGLPPRHLGWRQFRALGASALDLCLVASGVLDGFVDCSPSAHGVWDYGAAALVCVEAGAVIADAHGRDLLVREHEARRTPVAAATPSLLASLLAERATWD